MSKETDPSASLSETPIKLRSPESDSSQKSKQHFHFETRLLEVEEIVYKMQRILGYEVVSKEITKANNLVTPKVIKEIFRHATVCFLLSEDEQELTFKNKIIEVPQGYKKLTPRKAFKKFSIEQLTYARENPSLHLK